jgi:phosphonate transport system permease protein
MSHGLLTLPESQLEPLRRAYAHAQLKRRTQMLFALTLLLGAIVLSGITADIRPDTLFAHVDRLFGYFGRIFHLENHRPVWTDPVEWFWGPKKWLRLIGETSVIAYLGAVIAGGIGLHLTEVIRTLEWQQVAFLVLMILVTVAIIDLVSFRIRFAIIGEPPARGYST